MCWPAVALRLHVVGELFLALQCAQLGQARYSNRKVTRELLDDPNGLLQHEEGGPAEPGAISTLRRAQLAAKASAHAAARSTAVSQCSSVADCAAGRVTRHGGGLVHTEPDARIKEAQLRLEAAHATRDALGSASSPTTSAEKRAAAEEVSAATWGLQLEQKEAAKLRQRLQILQTRLAAGQLDGVNHHQVLCQCVCVCVCMCVSVCAAVCAVCCIIVLPC